MENIRKYKAIFITIGSAISSFFGVLFVPILLMVICNTIDFITGIIASWFEGKTITSEQFYKGIVKKVCMWLLVVVGVIIDETLKYSLEQFGLVLPFSFLIACVVAVWIICNELLSVIENLDRSGIPLPEFLKKLLKYMKHQTEAKVVVPDIEADEGEGEGDAEG